MSRTLFRGLFRSGALVLVLGLTGCAGTSGLNAIVGTLGQVIANDDLAAKVPINPALRYLRFVIDGHTGLFVQGYEDADAGGPIEVWYSAQREVVRFQNGRLLDAVGLTIEWRSVQIPVFPAWSVLANIGAPLHWARVRDVMPGYRAGVRDALWLRVTQPPSRHNLVGVKPGSVTWFEETVEGGDLPLARYAVDFSGGREVVVYGEQCLSPTVCFSWQRWPVGQVR
jgi:hypothetical protein